MSDQTTAPVEQSEQPKEVAQQPEATPEVKESVLAEPVKLRKLKQKSLSN